jgi:hypothetical protein
MLDLWFWSGGIEAQTRIAVAGADDAASIQLPALVVSSRFDFTISRLALEIAFDDLQSSF